MKNCEYFLLHYVPAISGDIRIPVGILLLDGAAAAVHSLMTRNWKKIRCLDPQADLELLDSLGSVWEQLPEATGESSEELRRRLTGMSDEFSGAVQLSAPRGVLTDDPHRELDRLYREHVIGRVSHRAGKRMRPGGRSWIRRRIGESLKRHHLEGRVQSGFSVEEFTAPGDRFQIDYAYKPNGVTKLLHALSLDQDWNRAKILSCTFWRIRERMQTSLTAIVGDLSPRSPAAAACARMLEDSDIAIQPVSGLDDYLDGVRGELASR